MQYTNHCGRGAPRRPVAAAGPSGPETKLRKMKTGLVDASADLLVCWEGMGKGRGRAKENSSWSERNRRPRRRAGNISLEVTNFSDWDLHEFWDQVKLLAGLVDRQLLQPHFSLPEMTGMSVLPMCIFRATGKAPKPPCHPSPVRSCCPQRCP